MDSGLEPGLSRAWEGGPVAGPRCQVGLRRCGDVDQVGVKARGLGGLIPGWNILTLFLNLLLKLKRNILIF